MGMHQTPQMAEVFGVPTFYVTHCVIENAGSGNVRIWNCTMRAGILIPNSEIIVPVQRLVAIGEDVKMFAQELSNTEPILLGEVCH